MKTLGLLSNLDLLGEPESAAKARAHVRQVLRDIDGVEVETAELLVSELVANTIQHSMSGYRPDGVVRLYVSATRRVLHVDVIDQGPVDGVPQIPVKVDALSECGRGLWLVGALSSAWGWAADHAGQTVWFELARS
ncbi:ATP-binding protein [Sphaerisporangium sp. NPDC049003]|uniref:ATP-binding protein n=1 Tax=Sphaerisporangium sp. NPDC049003 TaxID=3364517 RepID=UPI00372110EB